MSKNRIKSLRDITVDGIEYKWSCVDVFKVWKNKRVIYEEKYNVEEIYPEVNYISNGKITPGIVAKVIRQINGVEKTYTSEELRYAFENEGELGTGYYSMFTSFEDKEVERLWFNFNECKNKLEEYFNKNN